MNKQENIEPKILELIDKYLVRTTKKPNENSSTICIRGAMENRTGKYIAKSKLNEIITSKNRFEYSVENLDNYYFNILQRDILLLRASKEVLEKLNRKLNNPFKEYTKLRSFRNANYYRYTFKYLIKLKCSDFFGKLIHSEKFIYEIIARELMINTSTLIEYIELFNIDNTFDIPQNIMEKLLEIFNISYEESITNDNYYYR